MKTYNNPSLFHSLASLHYNPSISPQKQARSMRNQYKYQGNTCSNVRFKIGNGMKAGVGWSEEMEESGGSGGTGRIAFKKIQSMEQNYGHYFQGCVGEDVSLSNISVDKIKNVYGNERLKNSKADGYDHKNNNNNLRNTVQTKNNQDHHHHNQHHKDHHAHNKNQQNNKLKLTSPQHRLIQQNPQTRSWYYSTQDYSPLKRNLNINKIGDVYIMNNRNESGHYQNQKRVYKKYMTSLQIQELHQHSLHHCLGYNRSPENKDKFNVSNGSSSRNCKKESTVHPQVNHLANSQVNAKQKLNLKIPNRSDQNQSKKQPNTPNFLTNKKKINFYNNKFHPSTSISNPTILQQLTLKVLTQNSNPNKNPKITLTIMKLLAQNTPTTVYLVRQKSTKFLFCLKKTQIKSKIGTVQFEYLIREGKVGWKLDHPYLLKTYCTLYDEESIYQLMEYMEGKTLFQKSCQQRWNIYNGKNQNKFNTNTNTNSNNKHSVSQTPIPSQKPISTTSTKSSSQSQQTRDSTPSPKLPKPQQKIKSIRYILTNLFQSVSYMHKCQVMHRDIKPSNIFLSHDYSIKLGDFGSCGYVGLDLKEYVGTLDYVAPEVLLKKQYNQKVDMWSLGCLAYELFTGLPPFYNEQRQKTIQNIIYGEFNKNKIKDRLLLSLISLLLEKNIEKRISAHEALCHPFIDYQGRKISNQI